MFGIIPHIQTKRNKTRIQNQSSTPNTKTQKIPTKHDSKSHKRNNKKIHEKINRFLHTIPKQRHQKSNNNQKQEKTKKLGFKLRKLEEKNGKKIK